MIDYPTRIRQANYHDHDDTDLLARIGIALTSRQRIAWRVVRAIAQNGVVTLQGVVPTYYDRQVIVAVTQHVAGVRRVDDELQVVEPPARQQAAEEIEPAPASHGGTELKPEATINYFQRLPVLSPSLEDILAAQSERGPVAN